MVVQCCVCGKIRRGTRWEPNEPISPETRVTSTYCPDCSKEMHAIIRVERLQALRHASDISPLATA